MIKTVLKNILPINIAARLSKIYRGFNSYLYRTILFMSHQTKFKLFGMKSHKVKYLDQLTESVQLLPPQNSMVYSPCISPENMQSNMVVQAPSVNLYKLQNAIISTKSSNFVINDEVVIERVPYLDLKYCNYSTGAVLFHNESLALVSINNINLPEVDEAIFLAGNGAWNYYHWMVELLPKVEHILKAKLLDKTKNIVVSDSVVSNNTFYRTLGESLKGSDYNLVVLNQNELYRFKTLHVISSHSNILFNSKIKVANLSFNFYRKASLDYARTQVLNMVSRFDPGTLRLALDKLKSSDGCIKLFLARKEGSVRDYNQDEIGSTLLNQFDFKSIFIEDYEIEEQAHIFANADVIAGASGAAWTNLIFCKPNTVAFSWLPEHVAEFSAYSSIAEYYKVKMHFIACNAHEKGELHSSYYVSIDKLVECLIKNLPGKSGFI